MHSRYERFTPLVIYKVLKSQKRKRKNKDWETSVKGIKVVVKKQLKKRKIQEFLLLRWWKVKKLNYCAFPFKLCFYKHIFTYILSKFVCRDKYHLKISNAFQFHCNGLKVQCQNALQTCAFFNLILSLDTTVWSLWSSGSFQWIGAVACFISFR